MREIKFRAWDLKKMTYPKTVEIGVNLYTGNSAISFQLYNGGFTTTEHIMQFTGLRDKHNKDIYEGDILLWHNTTDEPDEDIDPVRFEDGCFKCGNDLLIDLDLDAMEIIGNIYENQELLEKP